MNELLKRKKCENKVKIEHSVQSTTVVTLSLTFVETLITNLCGNAIFNFWGNALITNLCGNAVSNFDDYGKP
jgi:hypothetical protein